MSSTFLNFVSVSGTKTRFETAAAINTGRWQQLARLRGQGKCKPTNLVDKKSKASLTVWNTWTSYVSVDDREIKNGMKVNLVSADNSQHEDDITFLLTETVNCKSQRHRFRRYGLGFVDSGQLADFKSVDKKVKRRLTTMGRRANSCQQCACGHSGGFGVVLWF